MSPGPRSGAEAMAKPPDTYPEDVREAFEYCTACEKIVVSVEQHTCGNGGSNTRKSAAERTRLADADPRPRDEDVLYPEGRSGNNAWAYHEVEDGEALHDVNYDAGHKIGPRSEAIGKGCHPCEICQRILDSREQEGGETDG